jgi:Co/Zn/Cd efflux system component
MDQSASGLRRVVRLVMLLNLACFGVEFAVAVAVAIGSVALFADSIDFLEDDSVNFLIAMALGCHRRHGLRHHTYGSRPGPT